MSKIEEYTKFAEDVAADDTHGYDQVDRWGNPNYDCSGLVITAVEKSGIPVKSKGASYTVNMLPIFKQCGFIDVTSECNLWNGTGMKRGDILLSVGHHTAIYCGNGRLVEASINEKGTITGGKSGDQTGREIWKHNYYNHPWSNILRFSEDDNNSKKKYDVICSGKPSAINESYAAWYETKSELNLRDDVGTDKKILATMPKGQNVKCYGYYKLCDNTPWFYVATKLNGKTYVGFCSSKYLKKVKNI